MKEKKILYIASEMIPYLPETDTAKMAFEAARKMNQKGAQIRVFTPRFGSINERRHQLHEVIRLSGMNLIINDMDMPLIIKVASIPKERMQVYFIDNDEYFKRKATFTNEDDELFEDNDERAIFFAKGVIETVKKLNWAPDIIHISGWMASLLPLYIRKYYKNEALFNDSKIVVSLFNEPFEDSLDKKMVDKVAFDGIEKENIDIISDPSFINLSKIAVNHADAIIKGSFALPLDLEAHLKECDKPILGYIPEEEFVDTYTEFYLNEVLNS